MHVAGDIGMGLNMKGGSSFMKKLFENIEKRIFIPAFLVLIVLTLTIYLFPGQVNGVISILFSLCTHELGWLFMLTCLASFGFMIWLTFSKYGNIKLGNKDEKPQYNNLSWIAMLFTAGVGTSIVILGFLEPIYYVSAPPFDLEPFSNAAYEYAHMYGQFHWGFSAWAFYNPAIVAIAYVMYVRKENSIRLSNACRSVLHKKSDGWLGHIVDILVVFGIVGSISTSLGIGAPVLSDIIREVFGIPAQYDFTVKIIVLIIWVLIFGTSVYLGLDKGIQRLSNINVVLAFIFMGLILLIGPTMQIFKMEVNSIGLYASDFIKMSTYTDPFGEGKFSSEWTVFYWGWWIAFAPLIGLFQVKLSKGRTVREYVIVNMFVPCLFLVAWMGIFGSSTIKMALDGNTAIADAISEFGSSVAFFAYIKQLPLSSIILIIATVAIVFSIITQTEAEILTVADMCVASDDELAVSDNFAPKKLKVFWGLMMSFIAFVLLYSGGLSAVQNISIILGLPMLILLLLMAVSSIKGFTHYKEYDKTLHPGEDYD